MEPVRLQRALRGTLALCLFALVLAVPRPAAADDEEPPGELVRRNILALVDSKDRGWWVDIQDPVHELLAMPLNHLGMVVRRHDIRQGPPPVKYCRDLRAVLTCFDETDTAPEWLWPWLEKMAKDPQLRFVHFQEWGPLIRTPEGEHDFSRLTQWLERFGLGYSPIFIQGPFGIETEFCDEALCALEEDPRRRASHRGPWNKSERNKVWITTKWSKGRDTARCPVVTGPWGGIAISPWTCESGTDEGDRKWFLDPFEFLRAALGLERVPAPHPNVVNGRRMFMFHVDGDAFESISTVEHGQWCGKVFIDEIVDKYDLPMTVSIIVASLTDDYATVEPTEKMKYARQLYERRNVEPASHTVLHPFWWMAPPPEEEHLGTRQRGFQNIENYEYDPVAEVTESIRFIDERLCPPGRRCQILLWSGDCVPPPESILATRELHNLNMNGGEYRWDNAFDSVGYVSPYARIIGDAIQVHCGAANDNMFDGFFTTMPTAFRHINETIERAGRDKILKPANIYIHFYSVERPARLRVLRELLDRWGLTEPTAPVFATDYAGAVDSMMRTARVYRTPTGWAFRDFGRCPTVRIDDEPREVDFKASRGIHGARRIGRSLYIHLTRPDAEVVLAEKPARHPYLEEANHLIHDVTISWRGVRLTAKAFSKREMVFAGFEPDALLEVVVGDEVVKRRADLQGRFALKLDGPGETPVEVRYP